MLTGILLQDKVQLNIFTAKDTEKEKLLMAALDKINSKFGRGKIQFGVSGMKRDWKSRPERRSPCYTTKWDELMLVTA